MPECENCGRHVSKAYARVKGVSGTVHECPHCDADQHADRHLPRSPPGTHV
jgi:transposase